MACVLARKSTLLFADVSRRRPFWWGQQLFLVCRPPLIVISSPGQSRRTKSRAGRKQVPCALASLGRSFLSSCPLLLAAPVAPLVAPLWLPCGGAPPNNPCNSAVLYRHLVGDCAEFRVVFAAQRVLQALFSGRKHVPRQLMGARTLAILGRFQRNSVRENRPLQCRPEFGRV